MDTKMRQTSMDYPGTNFQTISAYTDLPFYRKQIRIALKNCGIIAPQNIDEYIARDGYRALGKALTELSPDDVIATCWRLITPAGKTPKPAG